LKLHKGSWKWRWCVLGCVLLLLTACTSFVDQEQAARELALILDAEHAVGQTFVAQHGGLEGVAFWLEPSADLSGELVLHLRVSPEATADVATATLPAAQLGGPGFYEFTFAPQQDAHGTYYYAWLELRGAGSVQVSAADGATYLHGAAYVQHQPQDAQLTFRLLYTYPGIALDLLGAAWRWAGLLLLAGLLYIVPGWALLDWLWRGEPLPWPVKAGLAAGISLALYPLLLLWTDLIGLHLGALYAWLPVASGVAALLWYHRAWRPRQGWAALRAWARSETFWPDTTLLIVLALVFAVRLIVLSVHGLDAPMWGDSYHHTMIAQLLVDNGGLFDSWEPYAPMQSLTYHFGFHAAVAAFGWVSGQPLMMAVLWVGQILNGLAVLALYPLAYRIGRSRWAGALAVLLAGLLSPMPMYYVNWGRYTQLAGQIILPVAMWLSWRVFESPRRRWPEIGLVWLTLGGLALTHYRILIFYVLFVLLWLLLYGRMFWRKALSRVAVVATGGALLFLPWLMHIAGGQIVANFGRQLATPASQSQASSFIQEYNAIGELSFYLPMTSWVILAAAVGLGLWQRRRMVLLLAGWWIALLLVANPAWLQLPGSGAINNFALFIAVYIFWGIVVGGIAGEYLARLCHYKGGGLFLALLGTVIAVLGMFTRMQDLHPDIHAMITRPDVRAMAWIEENTAEDAYFLVNSFFAYGDSAIVGADGGWWLPFLTGRASTVPPLLYATEREPEPGYRQGVNSLARQIMERGVDDTTVLAMLYERGITHVYLGQGQGRVGYSGDFVLAPAVLLESPYYELRYHQDRVWIFEVVR